MASCRHDYISVHRGIGRGGGRGGGGRGRSEIPIASGLQLISFKPPEHQEGGGERGGGRRSPDGKHLASASYDHSLVSGI